MRGGNRQKTPLRLKMREKDGQLLISSWSLFLPEQNWHLSVTKKLPVVSRTIKSMLSLKARQHRFRQQHKMLLRVNGWFKDRHIGRMRAKFWTTAADDLRRVITKMLVVESK